LSLCLFTVEFLICERIFGTRDLHSLSYNLSALSHLKRLELVDPSIERCPNIYIYNVLTMQLDAALANPSPSFFANFPNLEVLYVNGVQYRPIIDDKTAGLKRLVLVESSQSQRPENSFKMI
jgi:hypothetical protein